MQKIINPGSVKIGNSEIFCKIQINDGKLSISGVVGPLKSGNCRGSCGQIDSTLKKEAAAAGIKYAKDWSRPLLEKLLTVWDCWHLNDMRPYCAHQAHYNLIVIARDKVNLYQWRLKPEISKKKDELEAEAIERAKTVDHNRSLGFYAQDRKILALEQFIKTTEPELTGDQARYYEATKDTYGYFAHVETKALGWLDQSEHPDGLLGRVCEVCGHKYGSSWIKEELPVDVIEFLAALPEATKTPAWV